MSAVHILRHTGPAFDDALPGDPLEYLYLPSTHPRKT